MRIVTQPQTSPYTFTWSPKKTREEEGGNTERTSCKVDENYKLAIFRVSTNSKYTWINETEGTLKATFRSSVDF